MPLRRSAFAIAVLVLFSHNRDMFAAGLKVVCVVRHTLLHGSNSDMVARCLGSITVTVTLCQFNFTVACGMWCGSHSAMSM